MEAVTVIGPGAWPSVRVFEKRPPGPACVVALPTVALPEVTCQLIVEFPMGERQLSVTVPLRVILSPALPATLFPPVMLSVRVVPGTILRIAGKTRYSPTTILIPVVVTVHEAIRLQCTRPEASDRGLPWQCAGPGLVLSSPAAIR